jgi:phosphomannomutase
MPLAAMGYREYMSKDTELASREPIPEESMVAVFSSSNHDAEMEAMAVKGVLDSNDIPSILIGPHILPNLEFQVQVPEHLANEARQLIRSARQDGRKAAEEAEAASE